jgi:putative addiction module killer protein
MQVRLYETAEGHSPVADWLDGLRDRAARARIVARLDRLSARAFGDWKSVGGGVGEMRIDFGPGFRVYFALIGKTVVLLLCAGDKSTQGTDIEKAHAYWKDYRARAPKPALQSSRSSAKSRRNRRVP